MFSRRIPADLNPTRFAALLADFRAARRPVVDLTESNPTRAGFDYPDHLLAGLSTPAALRYAPSPLGLDEAREAVSADFARRGARAPADAIALTASTSEAYSLLFKLLCDPGDEVVVPQPSYPLFEHLTQLDAVTPVPYALEYHGRWSIDLTSVERALSSRTRAVLIVSPNNPTGQVISPAELDQLAALCAPRGAALIADEVFADYPLASAPLPSGLLLSRTDVLGFTLGGLSKTIGLPQVKLGWIAVSGPADLRAMTMSRLELVCDTYLSVSTPVQLAAAGMLARGAGIRQQIHTRVRANYAKLLDRAAATPSCGVLHADAGWSAVVRVPSLMPEEDLMIALLTDHGVLAHPGFFFDFPAESFVVLSLLPQPAIFAEGIDRLFRHFDCSAGGA